MDQATIEKWVEKDLWSEKELGELCCGLEPNGARPCTEELNEVGEAIRRGILSKALPCICPSDATAGDRMYGHARFFRPGDAIEWASPKYLKFPFEVERLDRERNKSTETKTSRTSHANISDKLAKMNQASTKFWSNADRDARGTHPDNATVAAWLVKQGFSSTLANKAATIIRPEWAPTGRKPEE